jgi:hypothetical protein
MLLKIMHWMDAWALRRKDAFRGERPWGERAYVIHGSLIGKQYPSFVASSGKLVEVKGHGEGDDCAL